MMQKAGIHTPSILVKGVVWDKIWVKPWKYKSWITLKLLSLKMWKLYNYRFVLKNTFIKIYIYHFSTNIFYKNKWSKLCFGDRVAVLNVFISFPFWREYSSADIYEIGIRISLVLTLDRVNSVNILRCNMIMLLFCGNK